MRLIGRFNSPYVRRVAVTLNHYEIPFEHLSVVPFGDDKSTLRAQNPLARVPILEVSDADALWESSIILDYIEGLEKSAAPLMPKVGAPRLKVLKLLATASGAMDKLVTALYERHFKPKEMWYRPWINACEKQVEDGFAWLENELSGDYFVPGQLTQADMTVAVFWNFGRGRHPRLFDDALCPKISDLCDRLEAIPAFELSLPDDAPLEKGLTF